jgi:hypothetical protein
MPEETRLQAAGAFWRDEESAADHAEAVALIARRVKFRPQSALALGRDRKTRYLASFLDLPDALVARLLVAYHLAHERPLLGAFLDALAIPHTDGVITGQISRPDPDRLARAAAAVKATFPPTAIRLYFSTLVGQDPEVWGGLAGWLDEEGLGRAAPSAGPDERVAPDV